MDFLNELGKEIYERLRKHCSEKLKVMDIDDLELSMLANSFALYFECAKFCSDNGVKMVFVKDDDKKESKEDKKGGNYEQIRPEYTVMKNEYQNILKHGGKFGLNPGDRDKIFKGLDKKDDKKKGFNLAKTK